MRSMGLLFDQKQRDGSTLTKRLVSRKLEIRQIHGGHSRLSLLDSLALCHDSTLVNCMYDVRLLKFCQSGAVIPPPGAGSVESTSRNVA